MRLTSALLKMLSVQPRVSMFDAPVVVSASGLSPGQPVTIAAKIDHESGKFESRGRFISDQNGVVNLTCSPSLAGSYEGVHPMGLFTTLQQSWGQKDGLRFSPRGRILEPVIYTFQLFSGHNVADRPLHETTAERRFVHPAVKRSEVEEGRLRGALFTLKGFTGKQPAVIDIFGTGGGLMEHRSALLASKGFAVLSLAYFDYKDLPKTMDQIDLNYFEEAIEWLTSLPNTSDFAGFIGTSLGAAIAVMAGIRYPKLRAVVPINGLHMLDIFNPVKINGIPFHTVSGDMQHFDVSDGVLRYASFLDKIPTTEEAVFHIEDCPKETNWMFLPSGDDQACCSVKSATILERRMIAAGRGHQVRVEVLKNAGHMLDPPYMPYCEKSWHKHVGLHMIWGGDKYGHAAAQDIAWTKLIAFLSAKIGQPPPVPAFPSAKSAL